MSVCVTPIKQSFAQPSKFQLVFNRISNTVFYIKRIAIPGISTGEGKQPTPFVDLAVPGDKLQFGPLDFTFLVDSSYKAWTDIQQWLYGTGFPQNFDQYKDQAAATVRRPGQMANVGIRIPYGEATLIVFNAADEPLMQIEFKDCFPIALGQIDLDYQMADNEVIDCSASFRYSYFTVTRF